METKNSPYSIINNENKKDFKSNIPQQPSVPAGLNPNIPIQENMPNIPTYEIQDKNQKKIVDLQVYEQKKPNFLADKQANIALQPLALSSPFMPPQFQSYMNNMMKNFYTPFIYKDYNINIGGPNADRIKATVLYEDVLPTNEIYTTYKTLRERNNLAEYIRSTFIIRGEGEYKNFNGDGPNSLNSRLKLVELTPNNPSDFTNNPYKASAHNFLLYHSCYPIVYDKNDIGSQCAKPSTGLNVRVYNIYTGEIINLRSNKDFDFLTKVFNHAHFTNKTYYETRDKLITDRENIKNKYNTIRDLEYYKFIRTNICKNKVSPNFVQSYCYFLDEETRITFSKNSNGADGSTHKFSRNYNINNKELWYENAMSQLLLVLTESPEQSIKYWCSNGYVDNRNIRKQVRIGYKSDKIWDSIIAQMLISFYVMLKYKFVITEMTFEDSFYVKFINSSNDSSQYWVYNINNINYYIPNNGYLLMIDHNYCDNKDVEFKILSNISFNDDIQNINKAIYKNLKNCTSTSFFNSEQIIPDKAKTFLQEINEALITLDEDKFNKDVYESEILLKFLCKFLNNRIGTPLRELEKVKGPEEQKKFKKGEICALETKENGYEVVLFLENFNVGGDSKFKCINKVNDIFSEIDYDMGELFNFASPNMVNQDNKPGDSSFTLDNIIETYKI
jgi:hypothetical protein